MSKLIPLMAAGLGLALAGCNCQGTTGAGDDGGTVPSCEGIGVDFDGDNYGDGCPAGADCDDYDPTLTTDCPDANCSEGVYQNCPCDPSVDSEVSCYDGPAGTAGTLPCRKGMRSCDPTTSTWGACGGQVLPQTEVCDEEDNDCDGDIDEGVQSPCGNCIASCEEGGIDDDPFPMPPDDPGGSDGVGLDPNGDLILDTTTYSSHYLWIANDREGTVSKIDTDNGCEVARYPSVSHEVLINSTGGVAGTVPNWNQVGGDNYAINRPSRTAVDFRKDVWVANRAPSYQATITKIMNAEDDCVERNGTAGIQTSHDVNGDCRIDINNPQEFFGEADECVKMTVEVGAVASGGWGARAITIDRGIDPGDPGDAWVGIHHEGAFYEINGRTGELEQRVPPSGNLGINPYGAAIDSGGKLWGVNHAGNPDLIWINTTTNPATYSGAPTTVPGAPGSYGIVIDTEDRVWIAGYGGSTVSRYTPSTGTGDTVDCFTAAGYTGMMSRGLAIDTLGNVWAAAHNPGRVARINADTMACSVFDAYNPAGTNSVPVGVGVDFSGNVWTVNQATSDTTKITIDPVTHEPTTVQEFPTGPNPYTYSDFTGLGLVTVTRPTGDWATPIDGCEGTDEAQWLAVVWDATIPANTAVEIWVRVGNDLATLDDQPSYGPWTTSPADLQDAPGPVPDGQYLLLTIRLISEDGETSPIVHGYSVQWACPGVPVP